MGAYVFVDRSVTFGVRERARSMVRDPAVCVPRLRPLTPIRAYILTLARVYFNPMRTCILTPCARVPASE